MPPKAAPKANKQTARPSISSAASLLRIPEDAIPGFEERIETGIPWNAAEVGFRHHAKQCRRTDLPVVTFRDALRHKIDCSLLGNLLREDSTLSLEEQVELIPLDIWDCERFGTEEAKICFRSKNSITDNMVRIINEAVKKGGRKGLRERLKKITTLRLIDSKMTDLDGTASHLTELSLLNLCGNYLLAPPTSLLPQQLHALELQANRIAELSCLQPPPSQLTYLGLARNFLSDDCGLEALRFSSITVLDLSDNDIYQLEPIVEVLSELQNLSSLSLAGNPCAVCAAYATFVLSRLRRLRWLDGRAPLPSDRPDPPDPAAAPEPPHPDDLRSAYFVFTCYRLMSLPQPPKAEKGCTMMFHVELELPLLDGARRQFLMYRRPESLIELLPEPEGTVSSSSAFRVSAQGSKLEQKSAGNLKTSKMTINESKQSRFEMEEEEDIYARLMTKNSREIVHITVFKSNSVPWAKIMNFQEPTIKIFCPNLKALRDTFRTEVTVRLVFTMTSSTKGGGGGASGKKGAPASVLGPSEQYRVLCSPVCSLRAPNWSQRMQDFHWDDSMPTDTALHWGDGDLSILQYNQPNEKKPVKGTKAGADADAVNPLRQVPPANLTCHFGFGVETLIDDMRR